MGKGSGQTQKVAVSNSIGGGMFSTGKKSKQHVGIDCTPEGAFGVTAALIGSTLVLHIVSRFFK